MCFDRDATELHTVGQLAWAIRNVLGADAFGRFVDHALCLSADDEEAPRLWLVHGGFERRGACPRTTA